MCENNGEHIVYLLATTTSTGSVIMSAPTKGLRTQRYLVLSLLVKLRITNVALSLMVTLDVRLAGSFGFVSTLPSSFFTTKISYLPDFMYCILILFTLPWS